MSHDPFLNVIIPAYNEDATIAKTLAATRSYHDAQSYDYEIILSADGDDGTREKARYLSAGDERVKVSLYTKETPYDRSRKGPTTVHYESDWLPIRPGSNTQHISGLNVQLPQYTETFTVEFT